MHPTGVRDPIRFCKRCEQPFVTRASHMRFCSKACKKVPRPTYDQRVCPGCDQEFQPGHGLQRYCTKQCKIDKRARDERRSHDCPKCGRRVNNQRANTQCALCRRQGEREAKRNETRRRNARKRGARTEPYTLAEIAKRDNYRCGLCHRKVNMALIVPDPRAPTRDHIIPYADGGDDIRANVQLAHFICNSRKSAHGSQQLMLIG